MNYPYKKKRFIYNAIVPKKKEAVSSVPQPDFPDDFNTFTSQPNKKIKLTENNEEVVKKQTNKKDDFLFELIDDDFDFTQAADEIDQIEIAASQQVKTNGFTKAQPILIDGPKVNQVRQYNPFSDSQTVNSTLSLKIPKRKPILPSNSSSENLNNLSLQPNKNGITFSTKSRSGKDVTPTKEFSLGNKNVHTLQQRKLLEAQDQVKEYKNKLAETERKFHSKDGEIKILRDSMRKLTEEERKHKEMINRLENDLKTQQTEKEKNLFREVDRLKTQLEFKEREIQNALEKQRKTVHLKQSPKRTPSNKNSLGSGFQKDLPSKELKREPNISGPARPKAQKINKCKLLRKRIDSNYRMSTWSKEIIKHAESKIVKTEGIDFTCSHSVPCYKTQDFDFYRSLQQSLDIIENDIYFIGDFVGKVNKHINDMQCLLLKPKSGSLQSNKINQIEDDKSHSSCLFCEQSYEHGLKALMILHEVCCISAAVRKHLLYGLEFLQEQGRNTEHHQKNMKKIEIDKKEYFYKYTSGSTILTEDFHNLSVKSDKNHQHNNLESTLQLWKLVDQFKQFRISQLDEQLFLFYASLFSCPLEPACECLLKQLKTEKIAANYLSTTNLDRILDVLHLLQNCVEFDDVGGLICTCTEQCPLLVIYNTIINMEIGTCTKLLAVFRELVCFLSSFIASKQATALHLLLENKCQCSNEIIECMITILFDEFKFLQQKIFLTVETETPQQTKERLSTFRQAMSLLCILCSNDKALVEKRSAVECNYIHLLVGSIKMYRKIPSVNESEVLALEDLLDMDQYIELDEENMEVKDVSMETNQS